MQETTWKLYSPLRADFFPQEVYDDPYRMDTEGPIDLDGESLIAYAEDIRQAVERCNRQSGNLAEYIHDDYGSEYGVQINRKVLSVVPSVEVVDGELKGCATVKLRELLDQAETTALCDYLTGQYSDGWGEGFEQQEIPIRDGVLFVHFWNSGQFDIEVDWLLQAEQTAQPLQIRLTGKRSDIYAVLKLVSEKMEQNGQADRAMEMGRRVFGARSYDTAFTIIGEYMDVEYIWPAQPDRANKPKKKGDDAR